MGVLILDTNIFSYIMRDDSRSLPYQKLFPGTTLALSLMTVAELYEGAYRRGWGPKKFDELRSELGKYLIVPNTEAISELWGSFGRIGASIPLPATTHGLRQRRFFYGHALVTHNPNDFHSIDGLELITFA